MVPRPASEPILSKFYEGLQDRQSFKTWWGDHLDRAVEIALKAREIPYHTISVLHGAREIRADLTSPQRYLTGVMGGSVELPLAFDEVVTDDRTILSYPEVGLAVVPGLGGVALTYERAGRHNTELLVATGGSITGETAAKIGLADQIVPASRGAFMAAHERVASGLTPKHQKTEYELIEGDFVERSTKPAPLALKVIPKMMDGIEAAYQDQGIEGALRVNRDVCYELGLRAGFRSAVTAFKEAQDRRRAATPQR